MRTDLVADRERHREELRAAGGEPYPTWHGRTHAAANLSEQFDRLNQTKVTVAGRVHASREHGGVRFLDLADASGSTQLLCRADILGDAFTLLDAVDPGDVIGATGTVTKTRAGEVSVDVSAWWPLAKALRPPPDLHAGLKDEEERARHREFDLLTNPGTRKVFAIRARLVRSLREELLAAGFTEVETPILQHLAGGAAARPFRTHHEALDLDLTLRIAPELYLKRMIIGGYERVFELGRVFRNEGIDRQHNPEFTSCEFYQAYATVEDLVPFTERLLAEILRAATGSTTLVYQDQTLDFTPPWPRASFVPAVEDTTGVNVLAERSPDVYLAALARMGAVLPTDRSLPSLMDALVTEGVRKRTNGLLLLMDAPTELEPLAKRRPDEPRLVQRMQFMAAGMELIKAYTEENDPAEQEARFSAHAELRGHARIHPLDAAYVEALKIGLPPTAGWGLGVDRLAMLAADQPSIRDVLFFPLLRPKDNSTT